MIEDACRHQQPEMLMADTTFAKPLQLFCKLVEVKTLGIAC